MAERGRAHLLEQCEGFQWDSGNASKIWERHNVTPVECEELFFSRSLVVEDDPKHSQDEVRYYALGQTEASRYLFLVFTLRGRLIRVISARDMNRKERELYRHL